MSQSNETVVNKKIPHDDFHTNRQIDQNYKIFSVEEFFTYLFTGTSTKFCTNRNRLRYLSTDKTTSPTDFINLWGKFFIITHKINDLNK